MGRRHCGLVSDLQEFEIRMSESDLNTYKLQLQQVEAALTTDPENEELQQLKTDLEQVLALTQDLINAQLGASAAASSASGVERRRLRRRLQRNQRRRRVGGQKIQSYQSNLGRWANIAKRYTLWTGSIMMPKLRRSTQMGRCR